MYVYRRIYDGYVYVQIYARTCARFGHALVAALFLALLCRTVDCGGGCDDGGGGGDNGNNDCDDGISTRRQLLFSPRAR